MILDIIDAAGAKCAEDGPVERIDVGAVAIVEIVIIFGGPDDVDRPGHGERADVADHDFDVGIAGDEAAETVNRGRPRGEARRDHRIDMAARPDSAGEETRIIAAAGRELDDAQPGPHAGKGKDLGRMAAAIAPGILGRSGRVSDRGADRRGGPGRPLTLRRGDERERRNGRSGEMELRHVSPPLELSEAWRPRSQVPAMARSSPRTCSAKRRSRRLAPAVRRASKGVAVSSSRTKSASWPGSRPPILSLMPMTPAPPMVA